MKKNLLLILYLQISLVTVSFSQNYHKGNSFDDSLTVYSSKLKFNVAGDQFMTLNMDHDTTLETQTIAVQLLNPDFSVFKSINRTIKDTEGLEYWHNGIEIVENKETTGINYYVLYKSMVMINDSTYNQLVTVLNEDGDSVTSAPCSYMGFQTFKKDGLTKFVCELQDWDTTFWSNETSHGWFTFQVFTSSIYDVCTGNLEFSFPRGTQVTAIDSVDGDLRILTRNFNMERYRNNHANGMVENALNAFMYNLDYSVYKTCSNDFSIIGLSKDVITYSEMYHPIPSNKALYFKHTIGYNILNEQDEVIDSKSKILIVDENGVLLNPSEVGLNVYETLWLQTQQKDVMLTYDKVLSVPNLDSIATFDCYVKDKDGNVKFVNSTEQNITIYNEDLSIYKTLNNPGESWYLSGASIYDYDNDGKIELVFMGNVSGLLIINEDGKTVIEMPDIFPEYDTFFTMNPLVMRFKTEKYGRVVDSDAQSYYRTGPMKAKVTIDGVDNALNIELYKNVEGEPNLISLSEGTGILDKQVGEGIYYLRGLGGDLASNTYYQNSLLWEDATPIIFDTNDTIVHEIALKAKPESLQPTDIGTITGTISNYVSSNVAQLRISRTPEYEIFLIKSADSSLIATTTSINDTYTFNHIPFGAYKVLLNFPGKEMLSVNDVTLTEEQATADGVDYEISETGIIAHGSYVGIKQIKKGNFNFYPNPAIDILFFQNANVNEAVEIFDITGIKVHSTKLNGNILDINDLSSGIYYIRMQNQIEKLIKK
ncbi:MAG: T9SS type A sorting domain-containing protein [Bacteroidales bacterium]|nr:T9SS type A sorting domain-containing protein [Bacteroidales bacterium]MDD3906710.1 T9SS type A sorting domain-containing protein [Bacteroidales bacterium]MDD4712654.1 T9SS type A sorting domain-containing protein [Bacteroidales bacterium]